MKPERDGLFCEKSFGPTKDWECHCGKYKKIRYKGKVCDRCGVEVTRAKVRRERMGHIELAAPVSHIWYFKGIPSRMGLLLDISPRILEKVLYFASYIVTDPGFTPLLKNQILNEREYMDMREKYEDDFDAGMGAEAVKKLLQDVDLEELSVSLRAELKAASGQKKARIVKRLEVVDAFLVSGNKPEWMVIDVLPVIPPEIRPMVQLDGGRFATSDLNDLYRRVINRNNRLKRLLQLNAPDIIVRNEKRMLQEAVDALIDNGRRGRAVTGANNRALKSLSDMLKGKQGRFRQNLLGKRVDYSGRSVIVVGPELKLYQCGLPKEMAIELFRPFVMKKLVEDGDASNIKSAKKMVDKGLPKVWDALEFVIKDHPVMLNRAPTLHRLGIQAFEPVLVEGRAIKLHPLVCTPFNADFDGDQMAVHVPLSAEAQTEARILMLSANNLLRPQDGSPVTVPTQDMVLGSYYLTYERERMPIAERTYASVDEAMQAMRDGAFDGNTVIWVATESTAKAYVPYVRTTGYLLQDAAQSGEEPAAYYRRFTSDTEALLAFDHCILERNKKNTNFVDPALLENQDELDIHEPIMVYREGVCDGKPYCGYVKTTVGRLMFNDKIPQDLGFQNRNDTQTALMPEVNQVCGKKLLGKIIDRCISKHGFAVAAEVLDAVKALGYHYSTLASLTVSIYDMSIPPTKYEMITATENKVLEIENLFKMGLLTDEERYRLVIREWEATTGKVSDALMENLDPFNPSFIMADSGARGSMAQIRQLAGMRGLLANPAGKTIEIPVKANYREGLTVLEYFISSRGARKGLADTALRTADSGYLTRRLVDVAQEVIIREQDCGTSDGINVYELSEGGQVIEEFSERIKGRFLSETKCDPETGEVLFDKDRMLAAEDAKVLNARGISSIKVRSVLTCRARLGVCSKCYGMNMAIGEQVGMGEAVGIIAAQSIGEPGTQLTMRTFHSGGVAGGDITQGLPRVEELFEARKPKKMAQLAEISGRVSIEETKKGSMVNVTISGEDGSTVTYLLPYSSLLVKEGDWVDKGFQMVHGALYPQDVLRVRGVPALHEYLVMEVLKPYRSQGVDINDKHIEVICRQMMRKVRVEDAGDSDLLSGSTINLMTFEDAKAAVQARIDARKDNEDSEELKLPTCTRLLLGITKASLATESWLSAASFQETTKVLTEAAICGKEDRLLGLKENVIIGKLIPGGSGLVQYRKCDAIDDEGSVEIAEDNEADELIELQPVSVAVDEIDAD